MEVLSKKKYMNIKSIEIITYVGILLLYSILYSYTKYNICEYAIYNQIKRGMQLKSSSNTNSY